MSPPMKLSPPTVALQQRERQLAEQYLSRREQALLRGPWPGIIRDLQSTRAPIAGARDSVGLVARADPEVGSEVLINDGGWVRVDPTRLPLGSSTDTVVSLVRDFPLVADTTKEPSGSESTQGVVVVSKQNLGVPSAGDGTVWRLDPSSTQWTQIPFTTGTGSAIAADELSATVDGDAATSGSDPAPVSVMSMVEAVTFAPGAPGAARATLSTDQVNNGQIDQPAFIFTNNYDPVMVYPRANSVLEYEPLTDQFGIAGNSCDFRCVSLEVFAGRVNFFNTLEGVGANRVRFRNRLRRTARGTCDPVAAVGSGQTDFEDFEGHGVKCKRLGNVLACYFQDGVAFVSETGQVTAPYAIQTLDERRGLLSTSGLVSISNNEHFGIFDDGWWVLDASGRWREVGVVSIDGRPLEKWKSYFFSRFNPIVKHRLQLLYDETGTENWVRMAVPTIDSNSKVTEVWNFDLASDRVWRDVYPDGVSAWGSVTIRGSTALIWSAATQTWDTIAGSWQSFGAATGDKRLVHGTEAGLVHYHQSNFITRDGAQPTWSYDSVLSDLGRPGVIKVSDRISMEHVDSANDTGCTLGVSGGDGSSEFHTVDLDTGSPGAIVYARSHNRVVNEHLATSATGSGPVRIRGFVFDYSDEQIETLDR